MKKKMGPRFWVAVALVLCLVSSIGASLIQTDGGSVEYHDVTFVTDSGHELDALLLVPETATAENPAPAIVVSHGWYNNREMQDLNYVEYARRGYVVIAISMYGHGDSEVIASNSWWDDVNNANGLYDAVKYLSRLPFVDASRIGVTGHSNGALAAREAVLQDEEGLIAAALLVSNDAVYTDENGSFYNMFGSRDAAIVACQYDEFFHRVYSADGSFTAPRDFLKQSTAQSFLYFGQDPTGLEAREAGVFYTEEIDGQEAVRAIYNPAITHPWAHFSKNVVAFSVDFFDRALGAPIALANNDQIWQWKAAFNAVGVVGFFMFVVFCALALLDTPYFSSLKAENEVLPRPALSGKGQARLLDRPDLLRDLRHHRLFCGLHRGLCHLAVLLLEPGALPHHRPLVPALRSVHAAGAAAEQQEGHGGQGGAGHQNRLGQAGQDRGSGSRCGLRLLCPGLPV